MLAFALTGLLVLVLVGVASVLVMRRLGTAQAVRQAERIAEVAGRGVVEPRLREGILTGDSASLLAIDALVSGGVLRGPISAVTIRDRDGRVLYSDTPDLIGSSVPLDRSEREALRTDDAVTSERDAPAPHFGSGEAAGPLLEVSVPVTTPRGHELLFQAAIPRDAVTTSANELWVAFLPVLAGALVVLAVVQIPLAIRLARQVRASQRERERLLRRAIESSDLERRRIAGDLHDGPIQELAGLSMSLSAAADVAPSDPAAGSLREAAAATRSSVRELRAALMGLYPPNVRRAGLSAAIDDLIAPMTEHGVATEAAVPPGLDLPPDVEALLFRAAREALRNVERHANAKRVRVRVRLTGDAVVLEIEDDGVGMPAEDRLDRSDGHVGLPLLRDLVSDAGGTLEVGPGDGRGTTVRLEVPIR